MKRLILLLIVTVALFAQGWDYEITVASGDRADTTNLQFGTDFRGSDLYDEGLDIVFPVAPPSGMYAYFPFDDPGFPGISMLTSDFRDNTEEEILWFVRIDGDLSLTPRRISWSHLTFPFDLGSESMLEIGANYPGLEPASWANMAFTSSIDALSGQVIHIRLASSVTTDTTPPWIPSYFPVDGSEFVDSSTTMQFTIRDDMSGVDSSSIELRISGSLIPSSLLDWSRITMGYGIGYIPEGGWTLGDSVCVEINADDFADNSMTPFIFCFEISTGGLPEIPPYYTNFSITPGDTDILVGEDITLEIRDDEEGVDITSISVNVDGGLWEDITVTELIGFPLNYLLSINAPDGGWLTSTWYEIEVSASNISDSALFSDTTFTFRTEEEASVPPFDLGALSVWSSEDSDTEWTALVLGTSPDASSNYDLGLDIPSVLPSFVTYAYFPLDDPSSSGIDKLSTDIRHNDSEIVWQIELNNPLDECGIIWDIDELLLAIEGTSGFFRIASGLSDVGLYWHDMETSTSLDFDAGHSVYIKFASEPPDSESVPPRLSDREPSPDEEMVPITSDVSFKVTDADDDVDIASLQVFFGPVSGILGEIDTDDLDISPYPSGYSVEYDISGLLEYETEYEVRVIVSDLEGREIDISWTFTITPFCSPEFLRAINFSHFSSDTMTQSRTLGTDEYALIGIDVLDTAVPMFPPGMTFYFPIDDPIYQYLESDIRPTCSGVQYWQVDLHNGTGNKQASWDSSTVNIDAFWSLAIAKTISSETTPPELAEFTDMRSISTFDYTASEKVWIVLTDTTLVHETYCITGSVDLCLDDDDSTSVLVEILEDSTSTSIASGGGSFSICDVVNGSYTLVVSAEPYDPETLDVVIEYDDAEVGEIVLHSSLCDPGAIVIGSIAFDDEPAVGFNVEMGWAFAVTNDDGDFNLGEWIPGVYELCLRSSLPCYPDTCWDITIEDSDTFVIDFNYIAPVYDITGTVYVDAVPVSGVDIFACTDTLTPLATTDADGHYEVLASRCGSYCIVASFPGYPSIEESGTLDDDQVIDFNFFTDMIVVSIDVTTDCGDTSEISIMEDGLPVGTLRYSTTAVAGSSFDFEVFGLFTTSWDTTLTDVTEDVSIEVNLSCLLPVTGFEVSTVDFERPLSPTDVIVNTLTWTLPVSSVPLGGILISREGEAIDTLDPTTTEYLDTDIEAGTSYQYCIDAFYTIDGFDRFSRPIPCISVIPSVSADPSDILVIDWDNSETPITGSGVAEAFVALLEGSAMGLTSAFTVTDQDPENLDGFDLSDYSFISLHTATEVIVPNDILVQVMLYSIENNGVLYVEAPDFGEDYSTTAGAPENFFNLFGLSYLGHDGNPWVDGNVEILRGEDPFSEISLRTDYLYMTEADNSIDDFTLDGAVLVLRDQDDLVRTTKYEAEPNKWRIASSIYLAATTDDNNVAERILSGLLWEAGIVADVEGLSEVQLPQSMTLTVRPNPFNSTCQIEFILSDASDVVLTVRDLSSRTVKQIDLGQKTIGAHSFEFNGESLETGVYSVSIESSTGTIFEKMVLIK